jgi:membrane protease YdiL (CAAX protease family)
MSANFLWLAPAAFLLALATAAFTEEFFFRGIFQRALTDRFNSAVFGIAVASIAFSLYHVPYAYLAGTWPSAGDLGHAFRLALVNGLLGGVALGVVFVRAQGSLVPSMLLHAAVNWIPVIRILSSWFGLGDLDYE